MAKEQARAARLVALALPTAATVSLRLSQFLVLVVLGQIPSSPVRNVLVAAVGTLSAFTIVTESGAANYILSRRQGHLGRGDYRTALAFQALLGLLGAAAAVTLSLTRSGGIVPVHYWLVLVAVAVSQVLDSLLRAARAPLLLGSRDAAYALPEFLLAVGKISTIGVAFATAQLGTLFALPVISLVIASWTIRSVRRDLLPERARVGHVAREIIPFGLTGSVSSMYSQLPVIVSAAVLPVSVTAMLTVACRVIQPLEILPGTASLQLLPRVRRLKRRLSQWWLAFLLTGALLATGALIAAPYIEKLFGLSSWNSLVYLLVAIALVPKAGNYFLAAGAMGYGGIRWRLLATCTVAGFSIASCLLLVGRFGAEGLATTMVVSEILLAVGLGIVLIKLKRNSEGTDS
ncbi:hypothetical protein HP550_06855 [Cellulomonas humilata]|uniref:Polysaccharide biosynthesis protein n=1 Tax=Cellulomonas humilata TaxID=144055 RepID=A0A7Y6A1J6_9CELL|nr:hypothetical protein [Cellulomonas humilata]NUU16967.1 hypothetical protein [Cellulomonas humilata]